jgi:hypothetical protein
MVVKAFVITKNKFSLTVPQTDQSNKFITLYLHPQLLE